MAHLGIYHEPISLGSAGYCTYGPFARYVSEFCRHFDKVTLFAPCANDDGYFAGTVLSSPNLTVVPLPFFLTHREASKHLRSLWHAFHAHAADLDIVNARGTAPFAYLLWLATRPQNAPFVYHLASDPFEVIARSPRYRGLRRILAKVLYTLDFEIQRQIIRHNLAFVSGTPPLLSRLPCNPQRVQSVITSSLSPDDYFARQDTCTDAQIRLLYVGGLRPEKRVCDILHAMRLLQSRPVRFTATIVGDGAELEPLQQLAAQLELTSTVTFAGAIPSGPRLNDYYNSADIFILPSVSEGSPKVVLEALAHSLPVVATRVGNVNQMLGNGQWGTMVDACSPDAIAKAAWHIVQSGDFRRTCIKDGFTFAKEHGVDGYVANMAERMTQLLAERRREAL